MVKRHGTIFLAVALAAALLGGCSPQPTGRMVSIPPPAYWTEELSGFRDARDELFRAGDETPLMAEDLASFRGLEYWQPDPGYYFVGPIVYYESPEQFKIVTTAGEWRDAAKVGRIHFELEGRELSLEVYRLLDSEPREGASAFFLPFMDGTTGQETYPAGRYVTLQGAPAGPYVLDFNRAHNPSCAYGEPGRFACPVTPPANRLPVRVEAGERGFKVPEEAAE